MEKDDIHIGFGIMGGWNHAQAHAQFVANVVDYGMNGKQHSMVAARNFLGGRFAPIGMKGVYLAVAFLPQ